MCLFCSIAEGEIPSRVVYEDDVCLAFLDINPVTKGHTVLISKKHYDNVLDCDEDVYAHMAKVARKLAKHHVEVLKANGVNILTNCKEAAGQSVPHFHIHIIPRYNETDGYNPEFKAQKDLDLDAICQKLKVEKL